MPIRVESFFGSGIAQYLDELARLRITVFREWPYLYDGSTEYETRYLRSYVVDDAVCAIAFDDDRVIGASTALPLTRHAEVQLPGLREAGIRPESIYYFGESVLLKEYRGRGLGHKFFDEREGQAMRLGFAWATFCAVVRPDSHPLRPSDYVPHDAFWSKRGYVRRPEFTCRLGWKDLDAHAESEKTMVFWFKSLDGSRR